MRTEKPLKILLAFILPFFCLSLAGQERYVDIQGQKFCIKEFGNGDITVIFENGMSDSLEIWGAIPDSVANFARVFLYDRADIGKSDTSRQDRTIPNMVDELRSILNHEHIDPPYVLVGHSLGGLTTRYFSSQYPDEVKGLLLLDPAPESFWKHMSKRALKKYIDGGNEWYETKFPEQYRKEWYQFIPNLAYMDSLKMDKQLPIILVSATAWNWYEYQEEILSGFENSQHIELDGEHHIFNNYPDSTINYIKELVTSSPAFAKPGTVQANGITIAYESFGDIDNEAIIMIQGTGATMLHYPAGMCEKLARNGYRIIRFDNRDVGLSTTLDTLGQPDWTAIFPFYKTCKPAPLPYTLLDMAKDVIGLMDALKIEKVHIVGASMGGAIAQIIAIHFPDRVFSLTSMSASSGNPDRPEGDEQALQAMTAPPPATNDPDTLANYLVNTYKALGATDSDSVLKARALGHIERSWQPDAVNRQIAAVFIGDYCDRRGDLAKIDIPTMIIHGDADPMVPLEAGKEVAATIPGAGLCIIHGMGHDISLEFVDEIVDCILKIVVKSRS